MRFMTIAALAASATFLVACDDDATTEPGPFANVAGDFEATSFQFTSAADPSVTHDLVTATGQPITLNLTDTGQFTSTFPTAAGTTRSLTGTFEVSGTQMSFSDAPFIDDTTVAPQSVQFTRTSTGLSFEDPNAEFDFGVGQAEPATLRAEFDQAL